MRYFFLGYFVLIAAVLAVVGFRGGKFSHPPIEIFNDMDRQPKGTAQETSAFFASGQMAQRPVPGTIPMGWEVPEVAASAGGEPNLDGYAFADDYLNTGKMGEYYGDGIPNELPIDEALFALGQEKYSIHCAVCHGASGNGAGVISKYGLVPTSLVTAPVADRAQRPDGNLYDVIVNGKGLMGGYGANLTLRDRWAIIAYVRALQDRLHMPAADAEDAYNAWAAENQPAE